MKIEPEEAEKLVEKILCHRDGEMIGDNSKVL